MQRAEETPAPNQYKQDDKATKRLRYDNIHLGTDRKTTLKDINLTPGPGHYLRVDEQYPRTFPHATRHRKGSPILTSMNLDPGQSIQTFAQNAVIDDIAEAKRNSICQ